MAHGGGAAAGELDTLRDENARLRAELAAMHEQNHMLRKKIDGVAPTYDARDDEIAFLKRRLAMVRELVKQAQEQGPHGVQPEAAPFPGVKVRSGTALAKNPTKLAVPEPIPPATESDPKDKSSLGKASAKKKWFGGASK